MEQIIELWHKVSQLVDPLKLKQGNTSALTNPGVIF